MPSKVSEIAKHRNLKQLFRMHKQIFNHLHFFMCIVQQKKVALATKKEEINQRKRWWKKFAHCILQVVTQSSVETNVIWWSEECAFFSILPQQNMNIIFDFIANKIKKTAFVFLFTIFFLLVYSLGNIHLSHRVMWNPFFLVSWWYGLKIVLTTIYFLIKKVHTLAHKKWYGNANRMNQKPNRMWYSLSACKNT